MRPQPRKAGDYMTPLVVEQITGRVSVDDGYRDTWAALPVAPLVWAEVTPVAGTDRIVADTQQVPVTHVVRFDYRPDVEADCRFADPQVPDRYLFIRSLADEGEGHVTWVATCEERTG
jgi:SPP1 family predicted phage head-tail adaptor